MKKMVMRVLPVILCMAAAGPAYGAQWRIGAEENAGRLYGKCRRCLDGKRTGDDERGGRGNEDCDRKQRQRAGIPAE